MRYDVPAPREPDDGVLLVDVRDALDRAARLHVEPPADAHESWSRGRRRRALKRTGAGALTGVVGVSALAVAFQTGLMGGDTDPEPTIAAVPDGYTTFVFAAPDAPDVEPETVSALDAPTVAELDGTAWTLADDLYDRDGTAASVVGSDPGTTTIAFAGTHWGVLADGCGADAFEGLTVLGDGRFTATGRFPADQRCTPEQAAASGFWADALERGGFLRALGDSWLLVSVVAPTTTEAPDGTAVETVTEAPATGSPATPTASREPAAPTQPQATSPTPTGTSGAPDPPAQTTPAPGPTEGALPGFTVAGETTVSEGWPGGGELFAPTVRAGRNDGFDRVVVDLTGTGTPTWRAAYQDEPVRDGSGLPVAIAGESVLQVTLTGMALPEPGDPVYDGGDFGLDTHTLGAVVEVIRTTPFEGQVQLFVGLAGDPRPYRVFLLQDPVRLVVDVQTG